MLVTGAASGMGRATARVFAAEAANVAVTDFSAEGAQAVAAEFAPRAERKGLDARCRRPGAIKTVVADVAAHFGGLDIVVNNAGISGASAIDGDGYEALWERQSRCC